ncbi:molybdopterin molybdenumtransferase MoeA [Candidatus Falkowbacteria bacterium]|nr:molybdopterin molybdenumtransferase MoeA [Candidatus Falkowbacteria bacterium]
MISVDQALAQVLALARPTGPETVDLRAALGRVLAAPAVAALTQPPFDAAAMDGYAICADDNRPGAMLTVVGEAAAGRGHAGALTPGQALRIFTGAPVPAGAGVVVLQEHVTRTGATITLPPIPEAHSNIRPAGQDFRLGEMLAPPLRLTARHLGLLAAMNVPQVTVARRPVVALLATGDELVMPGEVPGPGQIVSSNSFLLAAMAEEAGADVRMLPIARDTDASLRFALGLAEGADLIVTSGGASVGEHDLVARIAAQMGLDLAFHRIAMRPGKPLMAGRMGSAAFLGLPGNPVSAFACAHLFLRPMLAAMQGLPDASPTLRAELAEAVGPTGPRRSFLRAQLAPGAALPRITPCRNQDSALVSVLATADALLIRPEGDGPRAAGEIVDYLLI